MQNRRDGRAVRDHTVATSPSFAVKRMRHLEPDSSEGDSGLFLSGLSGLFLRATLAGGKLLLSFFISLHVCVCLFAA